MEDFLQAVMFYGFLALVAFCAQGVLSRSVEKVYKNGWMAGWRVRYLPILGVVTVSALIGLIAGMQV